jgi:hypothetical protein
VEYYAQMRLPALLLLASGLCHACDCSEPSVRDKREDADIIFRGTIVELRDSTKPLPSSFFQDEKKTVVFRVSRVWKGQVGQSFEMPGITETSACIGFWPPFLNVGEDLLVFANRAGGEYFTRICGYHKRAKDAERDFKTLGRGRKPQASVHVSK